VKTSRTMGLSLCPSFSEATKRLSRSLLVIMSIGQYTCQSETSTITHGALIEMALCCSGSSQFQNVRIINLWLPFQVLISFSAEQQYANCSKFRKFRRQLVHTTLATILQPLIPGMTKAEVVRCADGHFRRAVYGIGPYIADYPEQCLMACIVQGWCPK
jgi:Plavaka transposase